MQTDAILKAIDQQISQLQRARDLLATSTAIKLEGKRRGRPPGPRKIEIKDSVPLHARRAKRTMSSEGKARIAAAQKARWAVKRGVNQPAEPTAKKTVTKPKAVKKKRATPLKKITTPPDILPVNEAASDA